MVYDIRAIEEKTKQELDQVRVCVHDTVGKELNLVSCYMITKSHQYNFFSTTSLVTLVTFGGSCY